MKDKLKPHTAEIVREYSAGCGSTTLARKYAVQESSICRLLCRNGVERRPKESRNARKYLLNEGFFETVSQESAYWAGFLVADGCVSGSELKLFLAEKDLEHVMAFRQAMGSTHPIRATLDGCGKHQAYGISFRSRRLIASLIEWGVVERKGKADCVPSVLLKEDTFCSFTRGMLDGDGSVSLSVGSEHVHFLGTKRVLDFILTGIRRYLGINSWRVRPRPGNIYEARFGIMPSQLLIPWLYADNGPCLARKRRLAQQMTPRAPWVTVRYLRKHPDSPVAGLAHGAEYGLPSTIKKIVPRKEAK